MHVKDFDYFLPEELIAQTPLENRDHSRLLVLDKATGKVCHKHFYDITDYFMPGDVLILNNSKVIPARIFAKRSGTGGVVETLLLKQLENDCWEVLTKPGRKAMIGQILEYDENLTGEVIDIIEAVFC